MNKTFTLFFVFCFSTLSVLSQTKVIPYQELPTSTGNPTGSGMFFGATMSTSNFTVTFVGPSNRWIALGLGSSMSPCDALVYSNGQSFALHALGWNDYYCGNTSASNVTNDVIQDWNIISNTVASGQRTVVASRVLNTGNANDVAISFTASALNIVWARSASADYTLAYHGSSNRANGISLPWLSSPTASFSTLSTTICQGSSVVFNNLSSGGQTSYLWNFSGGNVATSTSTNPVVTYTAAGVYSVALTASNVIGTNTLTQLNYITVTPTVVPSISILQNSGTNPICSNAVCGFSANFTNGGPAPVFQWKVNGVNAGGNSPTFTATGLANPASITCVMTSGSVCASPSVNTSAAITLTVNSSAAASVAIALAGGGNPICNNSTATFTANAFNGGTSPTYQWKINNLPVGTNSPTFTTNTLSNGNVVTCEVVSSSTCAATTTAVSTGITMTVSAVLTPSININISSGSNPLCVGSTISFSASAGNGGNNPTYQWKVNGNNAGTNNAVFTSSTLANGAVINCILTSNSPCSSPNSATSTAITLTVNLIPVAPIITPGGAMQLCSGKSLTLSSSVASGNNWSNGANTQSISVTASGNYTVSQTQNGCTSPPSAAVSVTVIPSPTVTLLPVTALCKDDAALVLQGNPAGGVYSGTGVSGSSFNPSASGSGTFGVKYSYTATNACADTAVTSIVVSECTGINNHVVAKNNISVYPNPTSSAFTISAPNETILRIKITDLSGKVVYNKSAESARQVQINLQANDPGTYLIEIILVDRILHSRILLSE